MPGVRRRECGVGSAWRRRLWCLLRLVGLGVLLGAVYTLAEPRLYPAEREFGFGWGLAHGACMPMALPALVLGRDVPIYAASNTGRGYKLGYIAGINLCGLVFFGGAFGWPRRVVTTSTPDPGGLGGRPGG